MRSQSDIITIIIAVGVSVLILYYIIPKIIEAEIQAKQDEPSGITKVGSWTEIIIPQLVESDKSPKSASTSQISFSDPRDNCLLGEELILSLETHINITRMVCNCTAPTGETEWRICETDSCSQGQNVLDIINPGKGILAEEGYVITVSASDNYEWLCIEVTPTEENP